MQRGKDIESSNQTFDYVNSSLKALESKKFSVQLWK